MFNKCKKIRSQLLITFLARTLYELKNFEGIPFVLASLSQYTRRGKFYLTRQQKKNVIVFKKYFKSLLKYSERRNELELDFLKSRLEKEKDFVSGKSWFLEKIDEVRKSI